MKKIIMIVLAYCCFVISPCSAAPGGPHGAHGGPMRGPAMGNRPAMHAGVSMNHRPAGVNRPPMVRPPMNRPPMHHIGMRPPIHPPIYRPYRPLPLHRPYYYSSYYYPAPYYSTYTYYPVTTYSYETVTPVSSEVNTVLVSSPYAGINTAANVINTAANVAATIRYLTW